MYFVVSTYKFSWANCQKNQVRGVGGGVVLGKIRHGITVLINDAWREGPYLSKPKLIR
jgi:hypothetical protein